MVRQNAPVAVAGEPCGFDKAGIAPDVGFRARNANVKRQIDDGGGVNDVGNRIAERGDDTHRQHEQRERHDGVSHPADDAVPPAAKKARRQPQRHAEDEGQRHRRNRDTEVQPRGNDDARQNITPHRIGTEPVRHRGRLQRARGVGDQRIIRRNPRPHQRKRHKQGEQHEGEQCHRVFPEDVLDVLEGGGVHADLSGQAFTQASTQFSRITRGSIIA